MRVAGAMMMMVMVWMMLLQVYIMCIPIVGAGAAAGAAAANITANIATAVVQRIETGSRCCSRGGTTKDAAAATGGGGVHVHIAQHLVSTPLSQWVLVMSQASRAGWRMVTETLIVRILS